MLILVAAALGADTSFHAAGYGYAGLDVPLDGDPPGMTSVGFNPIFLWREGDRILVQSELAFSQGPEGFSAEMEYATLDLDVNGPVLSVGKFLTPAGQFMNRLHPSWINPLPDFPLSYRLGATPMTHVGILGQFAFHVGPRQKVALTAWVDNGLTGDEGGPSLMATIGDDDWDKGLGGRVGFFPVPLVELGVSAYTAGYTDDDRYTWVIGDAAVTLDALDIRGEYMRATWGGGGTFDSAWVSGAYRLSRFDRLRRLEPVVRFGYAAGQVPTPAEQMAMVGDIPVQLRSGTHGSGDVELGDEPLYEWCGGLNLYLRENVALRGAYVHNVETWSPTLRLSLAFGY